MKNVIQFPNTKSLNKNKSDNYSDFLENTDKYQNVLKLVEKRYNLKKDSSNLVFESYKNYSKDIFNHVNTSKKKLTDQVAKSFLFLMGSFSLLYIGLLITSFFHTSKICENILFSYSSKNIISIGCFFGIAFCLFQAARIIRNIVKNFHNIIDSQHIGLLTLSFLYTFAFALTPLYLLAINVVCHK